MISFRERKECEQKLPVVVVAVDKTETQVGSAEQGTIHELQETAVKIESYPGFS